MQVVDFDKDDYSTLLDWFTLAFGRHKKYKEKDLILCEKIRVMAREAIKEAEEEED